MARLEDHFLAQVRAPFEAFSKGVVPPYVRKALEPMRDKARDNSYQSWQLDQQQLLLSWLAESKDSQAAFEAELLRTDPVLLPISSRIKLPFMLRLMKGAGMSPTTLGFIEKGFSSGFRYVGEVPLAGLYGQVPLDKVHASEKSRYLISGGIDSLW